MSPKRGPKKPKRSRKEDADFFPKKPFSFLFYRFLLVFSLYNKKSVFDCPNLIYVPHKVYYCIGFSRTKLVSWPETLPP
jgi:hypothetical protein